MTAASSAACRAPKAPSGNTPRSASLPVLLGRARAAGWHLQQVTTDNGSEFRAKAFGAAVERLGAHRRFIRARRPNSDGCVERVDLSLHLRVRTG